MRSKAKGNAYERKIGDALGNWWWGKPFRRTPCSGAWGKQTKHDGKLAPGDLYIPEEAGFPFSVECKKRKGISNLLNPSCELWKWWEQCTADADSAGRYPLLIFSENHGKDMVMFPTLCPPVILHSDERCLFHTHSGVHGVITTLRSFMVMTSAFRDTKWPK